MLSIPSRQTAHFKTQDDFPLGELINGDAEALAACAGPTLEAFNDRSGVISYHMVKSNMGDVLAVTELLAPSKPMLVELREACAAMLHPETDPDELKRRLAASAARILAKRLRN